VQHLPTLKLHLSQGFQHPSLTVLAPSGRSVTTSVCNLRVEPQSQARPRRARELADIRTHRTPRHLHLVPMHPAATDCRVRSNWQQTALTYLIRYWLALPGMTSGLMSPAGIRCCRPASPLQRRRTRLGVQHWACASQDPGDLFLVSASTPELQQSPMLRFGGTMGWAMNSNPVGSRIVRSMARWVQRNTTLAPLSFCRQGALAVQFPGIGARPCRRRQRGWCMLSAIPTHSPPRTSPPPTASASTESPPNRLHCKHPNAAQ